MDRVLLSAWRDSNTGYVIGSMLKEAMKGGLSVGKVGWNPAKRVGREKGQVRIVKIVPSQLYLDPLASNDHRADDCRYIIHVTRQRPEVIVYKYGTEGAAALGLRGAGGRKIGSFTKFVKALEKKVKEAAKGKTEDGEQVDRRVNVYECWIFPVTDRESDLVIGEMVDETKYPYGIVATMVNNQIVREPTANPFTKRRRVLEGEGMEVEGRTVQVGHAKHPFVLLYWSREDDADSFNGIYECQGMVQQQIPVQFAVDSLGRSIMQNAKTIANPGFDFIEDAVDLPRGRITLPPGGGLPISSKYVGRIDDVIRWRDGGQLPAFVYQFWRDKKEAVRMYGGIKPGMIGLEPTGTSHTPTGTIGGIQQASFSRMWDPTKEISACLFDIGLRYLGLIQQYYKSGRWVATSSSGSESYVEFQHAHISQQFRLEVVSGTTTPLYDVNRQEMLASIKVIVDQALASGIPEIMESTRIYLINLNYPHAYQWIQLLERKIEELRIMKQQLQGLGAMGVQAGMEQPPGMAQSPGGGLAETTETDGLDSLAESLGVPREQLLAALEGE